MNSEAQNAAERAREDAEWSEGAEVWLAEQRRIESAQWWPVTMADVVILERFPRPDDVEAERYWPV